VQTLRGLTLEVLARLDLEDWTQGVGDIPIARLSRGNLHKATSTLSSTSLLHLRVGNDSDPPRYLYHHS
jgi:hypothetical protein